MSRTRREHLYTVKFTGDHLTLFTTVQASNEEQAERHAKKQLLDYHDIDTENIGVWDIEVEEDGDFL